MTREKRTNRSPLAKALEAIDNLWGMSFAKIETSGQMVALVAHREIEASVVADKTGPFYQRLIPFRNELMAGLANTYRRAFKLALAHSREVASDPHEWTLNQMQPAIDATLDLIVEWYMLACDGAPRSVPTKETNQSAKAWRAPSWLFAVSAAYVGIGLLKEKHVPERNTEGKLGASHTRLLLKGARRVFLGQLGAAIETIRNEEIAAIGAIPAGPAQGISKTKESIVPKGTEGLTRKLDLSPYMDNLTEQQRLAFSLKYEFEVKKLSEIALRMGLNRKTAYDHLNAAERKIEQFRSSERRGARPTKDDQE